jgi:glycine cleavage system H protein
MKHTKTHQWIDAHGDIAIIGLSEKAQKELGEIVYLELPKVGLEVKKEEAVVVLESTKAAVDIYAPLSGKVIKVNQELLQDPEKINSLPEKEKWLYQISMQDLKELEQF